MTTSTQQNRTFFATMPVADVARSRAFFARLGFEFEPRMSGDNSACMIIGDQTYAMLLDQATFAQFSHRPMADAKTHALTLYSFSAPTREDVDTIAEAALAGGGTEADGPEDQGFMYTRSFFDLDGHGWQVMWTDPALTEQDSPDAVTVSA